MGEDNNGLHRSFLTTQLQSHPHFHGVLEFRDLYNLKVPNQFPQGYIFLEKNHFTCLVLLNREKCFYFDSCGNEKLKENFHLLSFLASLHVKTVVFNAKPIQTGCSDKCGLYCVFFLLRCITTEAKYQAFLDLFKRGCCFNDELIVALLNIDIT